MTNGEKLKEVFPNIVEKISEQVTETREEFIFETIRPYCENVVQMKISKRDLEQALLKYYGKNDLGVDAVSRDDVVRIVQHNTPIKALEKIRKLPSVTPQEPKTGEWIEHFDESGKWYECDQCHTDWGGAVNFCPNCGADMREVEE